jgi:7-keto-8-aminopelargonate synthetase-like enzyme
MNNYTNRAKMFELSDATWKYAQEQGVADLRVSYSQQAPFMKHGEHSFVNMASCSYLGLDTHPQILRGASEAIYRANSLHLTTPRYKLVSTHLENLEHLLSTHFNNPAMSYISCAAASSAFLPLYASGIFSNGQKPVMVFDKQAHFSINHIKPICADETSIITCEHNDLNYLEAICKKHKSVAYIAEGIYSINGVAPIEELITLQEKYGLFLYFDDSHGISIIGNKGQGHILNKLGQLNDRTVVVSSLAKAFGACGGVLLSGNSTYKEKLIRYGNSWSQYLNSAGIGAVEASINIHKTKTFQEIQNTWRSNLEYIDNSIPNLFNTGILSPTRVLHTVTTQQAISLSKEMFKVGYYVSPVFFPTVPKNAPGIRFMPRADMSIAVLRSFCDAIKILHKLE